MYIKIILYTCTSIYIYIFIDRYIYICLYCINKKSFATSLAVKLLILLIPNINRKPLTTHVTMCIRCIHLFDYFSPITYPMFLPTRWAWLVSNRLNLNVHHFPHVWSTSAIVSSISLLYFKVHPSCARFIAIYVEVSSFHVTDTYTKVIYRL